jgi:hypothetical protein
VAVDYFIPAWQLDFPTESISSVVTKKGLNDICKFCMTWPRLNKLRFIKLGLPTWLLLTFNMFKTEWANEISKICHLMDAMKF